MLGVSEKVHPPFKTHMTIRLICLKTRQPMKVILVDVYITAFAKGLTRFIVFEIRSFHYAVTKAAPGTNDSSTIELERRPS